MKIPVGPSSYPHACHMPRPFYRPSFDHPSDIWWGGKIVKLLIMQFYQPPATVSLLDPNIFLVTLFWNTLKPMFFCYFERPSFTPIHSNSQTYNFVHFSLSTFMEEQNILILINLICSSSLCTYGVHFLVSFPNVWALDAHPICLDIVDFVLQSFETWILV
jgi:hypothetical protein